MPVYMVERELPGIQMNQLAATQKAAIETSEQFTADGKPVRYIRTTFVPGEAHCMCLFEAANPELVNKAEFGGITQLLNREMRSMPKTTPSTASSSVASRPVRRRHDPPRRANAHG